MDQIRWQLHNLNFLEFEVRGGSRIGERDPRSLPPYTPGVHKVYVRNNFSERIA